ncbi:Ribosomal RNA small subunit methyltransferase [Dirofilaria immitis]
MWSIRVGLEILLSFAGNMFIRHVTGAFSNETEVAPIKSTIQMIQNCHNIRIRDICDLRLIATDKCV